MRTILSLAAAAAAAAAALLVSPALADHDGWHHATSLVDSPKYPEGFSHFEYVNPDAPKGGMVRLSETGTFDNLNPIIVRGAMTTARGIWFDPEFGNLVFEPLMQRSPDEAFTLYGLLAETVETDDARSFVEFTLNEKARFSDGKPVRVEDVLFTTEMMKIPGVVRPQYTNWLSKVDRIEKVGEQGMRFTFNDEADRELPLLLAGLPVLPEHGFDRATFERTTLEPVIGS